MIAVICTVIAALVLFGKNLADLILKWRDVLKTSRSNGNNRDFEIVNDDDSGPKYFIKGKGFEAVSTSENNGNVQKFRISKSGCELGNRQVLDLWESDNEFAEFYSAIFKKCGFGSYTWETPPISTSTLDQIFEFVILNAPKSSSTPDVDTFSEFFDRNANHHGIVSFLNLGHDAMLVVPSPLRDGANYSGLAEFFYEAPLDQQRALWKVTAHQIKLRLSEKNIWVSVVSGGISWLHVRLDSSPKYYSYMPYTIKCS
jgi:hypothetical protein